MDVAVEKSGGKIRSGRIDDLRRRADAVVGISDVGYAAACDRHICAFLYFARVHVDELCVAYDRFGGFVSLGNGDERFAALPKRGLAESVDHLGSKLFRPFARTREGRVRANGIACKATGGEAS